MLKAKKFTIIFTFFALISLFGTTFLPCAAFAESESSSVSAEVPKPTTPNSITADLPYYSFEDKVFDSLYSEGVFMVNLNTDIIVYQKNPDERFIPASLTKIMTALVCLENITDFSAKVECPYACTDEFWGDNPNYNGASTAGIVPKQDNLTYRDCLYGLMIQSGCEAANIIAYNVANGDIPTFISMMNETAKKIGCTNTHFSNTHGLYDKDNYTTPKDLYLITRYAMETYPEFMEICGSVSYDMPSNSTSPKGYTVYTTNEMMKANSSYYYEGVKGIKTGSINEYFEYNYDTKKWEKVQSRGTRALVTMCEKDGYSYLLITLGAPFYTEDGTSPKQQYTYLDHKALYDWAFSEFEYARVIEKNQFMMTAKVDLGQDTDEIGLVTNGEFFTLLPKDESISDSIVQTKLPDKENEIGVLTAPIEKGTYVADLQLIMNGTVVATIPLVTERFVAIDQNENYRRKVNSILKSPIFITAAVGVVLLIIAIIVIRTVTKMKKKEQLARRRVTINSSKNNNKRR